MVKVSPRRLAPPKVEDASVLESTENEARVLQTVAVGTSDGGAYLFEFVEEDGDWVGHNSRSAKPWAMVSAEWLAAAWEVAAEALRRKLGPGPDATARCQECGHVVPVPSGALGTVIEVLCGTEHALVFASGPAAVINAAGLSNGASCSVDAQGTRYGRVVQVFFLLLEALGINGTARTIGRVVQVFFLLLEVACTVALPP